MVELTNIKTATSNDCGELNREYSDEYQMFSEGGRKSLKVIIIILVITTLDQETESTKKRI